MFSSFSGLSYRFPDYFSSPCCDCLHASPCRYRLDLPQFWCFWSTMSRPPYLRDFGSLTPQIPQIGSRQNPQIMQIGSRWTLKIRMLRNMSLIPIGVYVLWGLCPWSRWWVRFLSYKYPLWPIMLHNWRAVYETESRQQNTTIYIVLSIYMNI